MDSTSVQFRERLTDWSDDRWSVASSGSVAQGQLITLNKGLLAILSQRKK
jgi:hypothetical protein